MPDLTAHSASTKVHLTMHSLSDLTVLKERLNARGLVEDTDYSADEDLLTVTIEVSKGNVVIT